ncbi:MULTISPECIES: YcaO-like family protein [unclassified Desulfovibrio]|uniref:YcaO-like family protein n=1 Tax=unclassified Desulfovibrio TaxID=2593640 RepID=UPI0013EBB68B|nr:MULTISPECIES: YcaO-like family protein [unclassified Desulfovibrio]
MTPDAPTPDTDAPAPLREYAYAHAQTVGSTGYFSCEPSPPLPLDAALAAFEAAPLDDFLHEHLLRLLGAQDNARLTALAESCLAPKPRPALAALLLECALLFPEAQAALAATLDALRAHAAPPAEAASGLRLAAAARDDREAALAWGELFLANMTGHRPLPRLEESDIPLPHAAPALARAMAEVTRKDAADILAATHARLAARDWPEGGRPPAQETYERAVNALERAGVFAGLEMRHEASLSPIALLRDWQVDVTVRNGRHAHRLRGTATAYGRGLSLAGARASCVMEVAERASAYASLGPGGAHGHGEVLGRLPPLPLRRATAAELTPAGLRPLLPGPAGDRLAGAPLHWVEARGAAGEALVPLQNVLLFCNADEPRLGASPGSTGLASGNSLEEARLSALMEVIERDADATTPFCRHACFTLQSRDPRLQGLLDDYAARGIRVQFQDITSEFGIPVYRAFVTARDGRVATATGAGLSGAQAALSALTETPWPYSWATPAPHGVASGPGLAGLGTRALEELPDWSLPTPKAGLALLEAVLAAHGREIFFVELTRADLGIPVVRVLVPGLEPHADFDSVTRPAPRLFARQALLNEGAGPDHPLFRN